MKMSSVRVKDEIIKISDIFLKEQIFRMNKFLIIK